MPTFMWSNPEFSGVLGGEDRGGDPKVMEEIVMDEAPVEEQEPTPLDKTLVFRFSMLQARQHYDHVPMEAEEEQAPAPVEEQQVFAFRLLHEEQWYNLYSSSNTDSRKVNL